MSVVARSYRVAVAAVAAAAFAAGCRSVPPPPAPPSTPYEVIPPLSADEAARAEALAYFSQGLMDEGRRDFAAALSNYQRAVTLDPENEDLCLRVAVGLLQQKRGDEAVRMIEELAARRPQSRKALTCLALIYRATDQADKVEQAYFQLIKLVPREPEPYIDLASYYLRNQREKDAITLLEKGIARSEQPADLLKTLGGLHVDRMLAAKDPAEKTAARRAAIKALEAARGKSPPDGTLEYQLGELYVREGRVADALDCFARVEERNPGNIQGRQKLALLFDGIGDRAGAIVALRDFAERNPTNAQAFYYLGELYGDSGDTTNALAAFIRAGELSESDPLPFLKQAVLRVESDPDAAIEALRLGLERMPENARLHETLAYVYFSRKDYSNALAFFASAREIAEKAAPGEAPNPAFFFNYAVAAQIAGELESAASLLNIAVAANPVYLDAYLQFAFRQRDDGVRRAAIDVLERVGQLQPDQPRVYAYLGYLNSYLKAYSAAIAAFEKAEALLQDSPRRDEVLSAAFYFWYASACERDGQFERAENLFTRCITVDAGYSEAYNYLAYMWAEKGVKLDQAIEYVQRALTLTPDSGAFIDTLGWIYYMQGDYQQALSHINRAAEIIPDDPTITEHLGDVLFKLGDEKLAVPHWERAFILDPENRALADKLRQQGVDLEPLRLKAEERRKQAAEEAEDAAILPLLEPDDLPEAGPEEEPAPDIITE